MKENPHNVPSPLVGKPLPHFDAQLLNDPEHLKGTSRRHPRESGDPAGRRHPRESGDPELNVLEKHRITDQDLVGHIALLNVWATWCISCRAEHSVLMHAAQTENVTIYGLDYKDSRPEALQWIKHYGNPYKAIIFDPKGTLAMELGVYGTPETFLIDKNGIIQYKYIGPVSPEAWSNDLLPKIKQLQRSVGRTSP